MLRNNDMVIAWFDPDIPDEILNEIKRELEDLILDNEKYKKYFDSVSIDDSYWLVDGG